MKSIKCPILYREASLDREKADKDKRTISLSFSSEEPVERWFGNEILDHNKKSVDLSRLNNSAPLLLGHNPDDQIGVVESARIEGKRGVADVRFSQSARAQEIWTDVSDGIRRNISVGYRVKKMTLEEENDDGPNTYRVTDWVPLEVSIVSVPADSSVGVGRAVDGTDPQEVIIDTKGQTMEPNSDTTLPPLEEPRGPDVEVIREEATKAENARITTIHEIAKRAQRVSQRDMRPVAEKAIKDRLTPEQFRTICLDMVCNAQPIPTPEPGRDMIGMKTRELERYSWSRAIMSFASNQFSGLEREVSDEFARQSGRAPNGFWVPPDVLAKRDLTASSATQASNLIGTNLMGSSFIELLRNSMVVRQAGATIMDGLVGNVAIPRQSGTLTAQWHSVTAGTEATATTEGNATFDQVTMTPKSCSAIQDYSKQLLLQSTPSIDMLVRRDLATVLGIGQDLAALHGTGSAQPTGVASTTGVGSVAIASTGGPITWAHVVRLETEVAQDNADIGSLAYITNAKVRGALKTTEKVSQSGIMLMYDAVSMIWNDGRPQPGPEAVGTLNGYRCFATNQVRSDLTKSTGRDLSAMFFGNWSDLIIGQWGGLDLLVDPYTQGANRVIRVIATLYTDICVRHPESFAVCLDIVTTPPTP